ncbi:uncharacterized protein BO66DRAFT_403834 [Aspergillus aculeatinus CBS 121060]|uniref:Uncharacterized protein n=1 Tax=Aspergillus aculeatinus CBS 121060 TaxID=1448322 RepID=A0ACD1H1J5_9EURO|nr:hypothetical protein BO66DRAFT_403834 [Aspergillus aculeatinus CBS 121060]RAH67379.1 hypothetical protein BO66DRAFT_403834 [Aspergillus aculeatinus CBS 121060]
MTESGDEASDYVVATPPGPHLRANSSIKPGPVEGVVQKIKTWLAPTDTTSPASEYRKHLNSHVSSTGDWILNTQQYHRWSETDAIGDLWIRGIPGSGKSVVAATMVRRLQQRGDAPVLFFFFRESTEDNQTPHSLLKDFCHGLIDHSPLLQSTLETLRQETPDGETALFNKLW